jgi:hypothetical protein
MAYMYADHRVKYCPKKHEEISKATSIHELAHLVEHNRYVLHQAITTSVYEELLSDTPDLFKSLRDTFEYVNTTLTTHTPSHLKFFQYQSISHILIDAVETVNNDPRIVQYKKAQYKRRMEERRLANKNKEHVITKKTRVLKKSLLETPIEDYCGICMDNHLKKETVQTSCGHCFGAECYERMLDLDGRKDPRKNICPMCRTKAPKLTYWRLPATRKPRCYKPTAEEQHNEAEQEQHNEAEQEQHNEAEQEQHNEAEQEQHNEAEQEQYNEAEQEQYNEAEQERQEEHTQTSFQTPRFIIIID